MKCQATFKEYCQYPKCDCDRKVEPGEVALKACKSFKELGGRGSKITCSCEKIHGVYNCKLNPF